jgi:hypothetical protein
MVPHGKRLLFLASSCTPERPLTQKTRQHRFRGPPSSNPAESIEDLETDAPFLQLPRTAEARKTCANNQNIRAGRHSSKSPVLEKDASTRGGQSNILRHPPDSAQVASDNAHRPRTDPYERFSAYGYHLAEPTRLLCLMVLWY